MLQSVFLDGLVATLLLPQVSWNWAGEGRVGTHLLLADNSAPDVLHKHHLELTTRAVGSAEVAVHSGLLGAVSCLLGTVPHKPQWEVGSCWFST